MIKEITDPHGIKFRVSIPEDSPKEAKEIFSKFDMAAPYYDTFEKWMSAGLENSEIRERLLNMGVEIKVEAVDD